MVVGLGYAVDQLELENLASKPTDQNFFQIYDRILVYLLYRISFENKVKF